ncbi:MAG: helix-turn-helix domain-containing protein [Planctomycetes bacterium]|nr:helix-turn-helix domain-containing protein [Planctomycetota bacterium]
MQDLCQSDSVDEVAEILRLKRDTVYRLAARGKIPGHKIGRVWRFPKDVIHAFLQRPQDHTPEISACVESERVASES